MNHSRKLTSTVHTVHQSKQGRHQTRMNLVLFTASHRGKTWKFGIS